MIPTQEIDLLVLGSGCGGMTAALMAAAAGLQVCLVEKTDRLGGSTAYSSGTAWVPGTHLARQAQPPDSTEAAATYLDWMLGTAAGRPLRDAFLASGAAAIAWLEQHSEVRFFLPPHGPDYRVGPGSATAGRALVIQPFDGRLLGADFALLREPRPGFNVLGGMMVGRADLNALLAPLSSWAAFRHATSILGRHLRDRLSHRRGTRLVMGNALVARLLTSLRARQVDIRLGTEVSELLMEQGRVVGALLRAPDGTPCRIHARRGVVLATGGFSASAAWRSRLLGGDAAGQDLRHSVASPGNSGDGLSLGAAAGAAVASQGHRSGAFWMPTSVHRQPGRAPVLFPHIVLDRAKPGLIAVNAHGARFVNESDSYHDFVSAMLDTEGMGAGKPAWLIVDARFLWRYGLGLVRPFQPSVRRFVRDGYLVRADTLEQLAAGIGVDPQGLGATVQRHNRFAQDGVDLDFGRGAAPLNQQNGDPRHQPNPCLAPIQQAPFYALAVWPADLATSAGLRTGPDAEVLSAEGQAIAGLYAVGNDMASIMQGTYPGPGTTLGPAMVFAYRAVQHLLAQPARAAATPQPGAAN